MTIRDSFAETFGEDMAVKVEEAALLHLNEFTVAMKRAGILIEGMPELPDAHADDNWGSDPFRYLFMVCIGRDCFRIGGDHDFTMSEGDVRLWSREHADLLSFDGDPPDYIALMVGAYYGYIDWEKAAEAGIAPPEHWAEHDAETQRRVNMTAEERTQDLGSMLDEGIKILNDHLARKKGPSEESND
jgi:hypothetical protein